MTQTWSIRPATADDLPTVFAIYACAREFQVATGNPHQWAKNGWPPEDLVREDIAVGRSFVCVDENDTVHGVFVYIFGADIDPTYRVIEDGAWGKDAPYGVVHRIAADGTPGVGGYCLCRAYEWSGHLRIDTHPDNTVMRHVLEREGFTRRGIIHVPQDDHPRIAFDRFAAVPTAE